MHRRLYLAISIDQRGNYVISCAPGSLAFPQQVSWRTVSHTSIGRPHLGAGKQQKKLFTTYSITYSFTYYIFTILHSMIITVQSVKLEKYQSVQVGSLSHWESISPAQVQINDNRCSGETTSQCPRGFSSRGPQTSLLIPHDWFFSWCPCQILVAWDHQWVAAHSAQREREDGCYRPNDLCWWALYQCSCLTSTTCVSIRVWSFRVMQPYAIYSQWQTAQLSGRILVRTCRWFLPHCQPVSSISSCPEAGPARHEEP